MAQCPDFEYIRTRVSIAAVAQKLGLRVNGYRAHCWRTESHRNGDANPSISFRKQQNTGRCFVCDPHTWSNIDLVMMVRDCDLSGAVSWLTTQFSIPMLPKGSHVKKRQGWQPNFRASDTNAAIPMLVRAGIWATLSHAEQSILATFTTFADQDTGLVTISYRGLMRYSGVGSSATVAKAIRHLEQMKILSVDRARGAYPVRGVSKYRLTFDDPDFQALVSRVFQKMRDEIEYERQAQEKARKDRGNSALLV
jgi:helix-turn-helix protein